MVGMEMVDVARDMDLWRALVEMVIKFEFYKIRHVCNPLIGYWLLKKHLLHELRDIFP
jgi:hypothetical protein